MEFRDYLDGCVVGRRTGTAKCIKGKATTAGAFFPDPFVLADRSDSFFPLVRETNRVRYVRR